jgi:hypothetical protein
MWMGLALRSQAYCTSVQAPSCKCGTKWALRSYTSGIFGGYSMNPKTDTRRSSAMGAPIMRHPRGHCGAKNLEHGVPWGQMKVTRVCGGRIKMRGSESGCRILPVIERKQHLSSHLIRRYIPYNHDVRRRTLESGILERWALAWRA